MRGCEEERSSSPTIGVWETVGVNFEVIFAALHEISYRGYVSSLRSERLGRESMQLALEEMINL
jgi:hypothetical protein